MPSSRVIFAAAGLSFAIALALALTLALPGSGAVQAQRGPVEPGAQGAGVTPAAATLTVSEVSYTTAKLTLSGHAGAWYYQADKAPHTGCTLAGSNTLLRLTGLTHKTEYTYKAYSDSACASGNQLGSAVTFTTLTKKLILTDYGQLHKSIGQNTATLRTVGFKTSLTYLKGDAANPTNAPHSTCTKWKDVEEPRIDVVALTRLEPNTSYTYLGYEDSACATEVARITFTTLPAELIASSLGLTTATLRLTGYLGRAFYYQADTGPHASPNCTLEGAVVTDDSQVSLSGLDKDTEYTYTAYTDSACTSTKKLDDVTFTTLSVVPTLTVSYVSPTTAKLTISEGWTANWYYAADAFESGDCDLGGGDETRVSYLTGLTPGAAYTFKAYASITGTGNECTAELGAEVTFTTPELTECDVLSIGEVGADYVEVKNNTNQAIRDVRALTYYTKGSISTYYADPVSDSSRHADEMSELRPGATGRMDTKGESDIKTLAALNGVVQLVDPATSAVLCETAIEPSWWGERVRSMVRANPEYWVSTQLDNPLPGSGENATFIVTAYATTTDQLLQACVNLDFDGVTPVDAADDGNHDVVIYDGPNGKYKEDGTLNVDSSNPPVALGKRRAGRLDYDSDGYDEDVASYEHRPQCSDAEGNFQGGLFRIGNTDRRTTSNAKWPTDAGAHNWPLTYTVKVPVTATGSGSGCLTATVRALPPERTDIIKSAYEKSLDNTDQACLGVPPKGDPSLPMLFQEGRADLVTVHKCAGGTSFPCDGKTAGNPAQYVNSGTDGGGGVRGNAADNAGSIYRAFQPTDVVFHVADSPETRAALDNTASPKVKQVYWRSGNDAGALPGVAAQWVVSRTDEFPGKVFCSSAADRTPNGRPGGLSFVDALYASARESWANLFNFKDASSVNESDKLADNYQLPSVVNPLLLEFRSLGTYVIDVTTSTKTSANLDNLGYALDCPKPQSTHPTDTGSVDTGTYKFHVGPAADLRVYPGGASDGVVSGKRAFTIVAESEATREVDASVTHHGHTDLINLESLQPTVEITANNAAIPAAKVSRVWASAGDYDTATGVWALPDGFKGQATLTLAADAGAVSSVTAKIANTAEVCLDANGSRKSVVNPGASTRKTSFSKEACEWHLDASGEWEQDANGNYESTGYHWGSYPAEVCEEDDGTQVYTVDGRAPVDRATCEFNKDGTSSSNHWGNYQRCIKPDATAYGANPHGAFHATSKKVCEDNVTNGTWHTTEWYDWRPHNNEATFTPDAAGFTLTARGVDGTSIDLLWAKQAGADDYAIYSISTADLTSTDNLGLLLTVNQIAVVPADTTAYYHDGLKRGQKRQYLIRARQDGRPFAMSNLAGATAQIPGQTQQGPPASRAPGYVGSLTAARKSGDDTTIDVSWNAPSSGATGYDVQYRSRLGSSGSYGNWTGLSTQQGGTTYTFNNAGGGTSYQFQVRAVNVFGGQTNYSGWSTSNTVSPVSNPNQVGSLTATRQSNGTTINVTWTAPTSGTPPTGYQVQYQSRTGNSGAWDAWAPDPATTQTTLSYALTVTGAKSYQFRVRTVTLTGGDTIMGSWRTSSVVRAFNNPDQVQNLTAARDDTTKTTINVSWNPPATNGTAPTHYDVQYQQDGGAWKPYTPDRQEESDRNYRLTNATGASTFRFRVRTETVSGGGTIYGNWAYSGTVAKLPAPGPAQNLTGTRAANETIIDLAWAAPSPGVTAPTHYDVQYQENGGAWQPTKPDRQVETNKAYQLNGTAKANSSYRFRVRSVTVSGTGANAGTILGSWAYSNTVPRLTAPSQVGNLTATRQQNDETKIDVTWTAPNNATGATRYDVQYKEDNDTNWSTAPNTTDLKATSYTLHDLADGSTVDGGSRYVFRVRGVTALTDGSELEGSWRSSNTVAGLPAGDIGSVTATRNTSDPTKINLTWSTSARAIGYDVQYRKDSGGWISAVTAANQPAASYTHDNAGGVETYQFRVRGVSDAGNGNWKDSDPVEPPPANYYGADVGVDWVTIKMTGGPWWYEFRKNGDWGGCTGVASGGVTITGLWPGVTHAANLYSSSGCASADRIGGGVQSWVTLSDIYDWSMCWPRQGTDENGNAVYTDCRDIDNPNDFNNHTHKRSRLHNLGVNLSDCAFSREHHSHGWPYGGGGQHWHCPN